MSSCSGPTRPTPSPSLPRRFSGFLFLATVLLTAGCGRVSTATENRASLVDGSHEPIRGRLVITGSSTVAPLAAEIARRFEQEHPGVRIDVQTGGSSRGIADVRSATADLGMASRGLTGEERDLLSFPLAIDGVSVVLNASNPTAALTTDQLRGIYTGALRQWSDLGGPEHPITVVHKADGRATQKVFLDHLGLKPSEVQPDIVIGDNQQGIKTVASDPWAIAYVSIGAATWEIEHGAELKLPSLDGVEPSLEALAAGRLPMTRPLNLVAASPPQGTAGAFVTYARSAAVVDLVEAQLFVPTTQP